MHTVKCYKESGLMHAYPCERYHYSPEGEVPFVYMDNNIDMPLHISNHPAHYVAIFVVNGMGNTVDAYRAGPKNPRKPCPA